MLQEKIDKVEADKHSINILDLLMLFVIIVSAISVALLCLNIFKSIYALTSGIALFAIITIWMKDKISFTIPKVNLWILMIILVAVVFRAAPYLYVWGGQDEGIYVNMSSYYENYGSTFIKDHIREGLNDNQKEYYDKLNQGNLSSVISGKYEGSHMPGIYISNLKESSYIFQFYPLHPLWMSIFGKIFGESNRAYSLMFFSVLSIFIFYLITREISRRNRIASYLTALFIALNPMHAFFSKFPVSEIVSIFFSATGLYYLVKYYNASKEHKYPVEYLILSSGSFICLFFNHIGGFMYIPLFYLLMIFSFFNEDKKIRNHITCYAIAIFSGFILALLYGMRFSFPYYFDIYNQTFGAYLGKAWEIKLLVLAVILAFTALIISSFRNRLKIYFNRLYPYIPRFIPILVYAIIIIALYNAYKLGFTDEYLNKEMGQRWNLAGLGFKSLIHANLFVLALYISPFSFLLFLLSVPIVKNNKSDIQYIALGILLTLFLFLRVVVERHTPYYYFGRYLTSEVLPYVILLISIYLGGLISKKGLSRIVAMTFIALITIYSIYFSYQQVGKGELAGLDKQLKGIQKQIGYNDLVLLDKNNIPVQMKTALQFYYNINVIYYDNINNLNGSMKDLFLQYENIFILSDDKYKGKLEDKNNVIPITISRYLGNQVIPTDYGHETNKYYIYRSNSNDIMLLKDAYEYGTKISFGVNGNSNMYKRDGWSNNEEQTTWTEGNKSSLHIPIDATDLDLEFVANVAPFSKQTVFVKVNGERVGEWTLDDGKYKDYTVTIPSRLIRDQVIDIEFEMPNAIAPSKILKDSNDDRVLALSFKYIAVNEK